MLKSLTATQIKITNNITQTIGRFAPSPTGHLHLGSLITAVASFCMAKQTNGQWFVRIEDIDWERCRPEFTDSILHDLERLGLYWDGSVRYQSQHFMNYHQILENQLQQVTYGCDCTRKKLQSYFQNLPTHYPKIYPRLCIDKQLNRQQQIRLYMPDHTLLFIDGLQGTQCQNPQKNQGDIVIKRKNGMINYMLAVVIDDAIQGVNQIVRGLDILPLTIPQLVLADYLHLPFIKKYYHLPILVNQYGQKLSKQTLAEPIFPYSASHLLQLALKILKQPTITIDKPEIMLQQAIIQWDLSPLIGIKQLPINQSLSDLIKL